jgi:hypothetical protein
VGLPFVSIIITIKIDIDGDTFIITCQARIAGKAEVDMERRPTLI